MLRGRMNDLALVIPDYSYGRAYGFMEWAYNV